MREIPPTAGLPLQWADLMATGGSLEQGLTDFLRIPAVQIECSGTASLIVTLHTLISQSSRKNVILPAYTCPLVALAVLNCGLTPVLCDLRQDSFDLDHAQLASLCDGQTLAILPTHLGGKVADLDPVLGLANNVGAFVIEDAAQSLGALWQGNPVGMVGDAGFYSLAVGKGLTIYEGGILVTRDADLREKLMATAEKIVPSKTLFELRRSLELLAYAALYQPRGLAVAYGLPLRRNLQQGRLIEAVGDDFDDDIPLHRVGRWRKQVGARALRRLPAFIEQQVGQARPRLRRLSAIPGIQVMQDAPGGAGVWPFFMVLMPDQAARDMALAALWGAGLGISRLYIHALPDYPYLNGRVGTAPVPRARAFAARMLSVSNSAWLDEASFDQICQQIEIAAQASRKAA